MKPYCDVCDKRINLNEQFMSIDYLYKDRAYNITTCSTLDCKIKKITDFLELCMVIEGRRKADAEIEDYRSQIKGLKNKIARASVYLFKLEEQIKHKRFFKKMI